MSIETIKDALAELSNLRGSIGGLYKRIDAIDGDLATARESGAKTLHVNIGGDWTVVPTVTAENITRELRDARECFVTQAEKIEAIIKMADNLTKGAFHE